MILKRFLKKVLIQLLLICLVLPVYFVNSSELKADGIMTVLVGSHEHSHLTNMVIYWQVGADFACDEKFSIFFENNIVDLAIGNNDANVMYIDGGGVGVDLSAYTSLSDRGANYLEFKRNGDPSCVTIPSGGTLAIYIGPKDDEASGYVTGAKNYIASGLDYFNVLASDVLTNNATGTDEMVYTYHLTKPDHDDVRGSYALIADNDYELNVDVAEYVSISITDSELLFGEMIGGNIYGDIAVMDIATNTPLGYTLAYKATEFESVDSTFLRAPSDFLSTGEWGINLQDNTSASVDLGAIPTGSPYTVAADYDAPNKYKAFTLNVLEDIMTTSGPSTNTVTLTGALLPSSNFVPGVYKGTINMNVYANL